MNTSASPDLSIIIPTRDRGETLRGALESLAAEAGAPGMEAWRIEVVVVDDGPSRPARDVVESVAGRAGPEMRYLCQPARGPAAARNLGIRAAHSGLVLLLGDDTPARPGLLRAHLELHRRHPEARVAVLGGIDWDPAIAGTPFMRFVLTRIPYIGFAFESIENPADAGYRHFYSSNVSLKTEFLLSKGLFDEDFRYAAYEDIELGFRLQRAGLRVLYNPEAGVWHRHRIDLDGACRRARQVAESHVLLQRKYPGGEIVKPLGDGLRLLPPSRRPWVLMRREGRRLGFAVLRRCLAPLTRTGLDLPLEPTYRAIIDHHFNLGWERAARA